MWPLKLAALTENCIPGRRSSLAGVKTGAPVRKIRTRWLLGVGREALFVWGGGGSDASQTSPLTLTPLSNITSRQEPQKGRPAVQKEGINSFFFVREVRQICKPKGNVSKSGAAAFHPARRHSCQVAAEAAFSPEMTPEWRSPPRPPRQPASDGLIAVSLPVLNDPSLKR